MCFARTTALQLRGCSCSLGDGDSGVISCEVGDGKDGILGDHGDDSDVVIRAMIAIIRVAVVIAIISPMRSMIPMIATVFSSTLS